MTNRLLALAMVGLLLGCSENKIKIYTYPSANPDAAPSVAPDTVTLALEREYPLPNVGLNDVVLFRVRDTMLFYSENIDGINHLNIYDIKNGRLMQSLLLLNSANELERRELARSIVIDVEPDTVSVLFYTLANGRFRHAIDDLVKGRVKMDRLRRVSDTYMIPCYYKDGYYIDKTFKHKSATNRVVNLQSGYERLYRYMPDNAKIKYLSTDIKAIRLLRRVRLFLSIWELKRSLRNGVSMSLLRTISTI